MDKKRSIEMSWDLNSRRGIAQLTAALSISVIVILVYINRDYNHAGFTYQFSLNEDIKKKSCLSRDASSSYRRNPSPHIPSPYLVAKLKSYEALHRRCGPKTHHYRQTIDEQKSSSSPSNNNSDCSYIIWTPAQGLGNQMASLVSAFLYALLTNRVLLVDFGPDLSNLFCEPFLGSYSSWKLPHDFPHRSNNFKHIPTLLSHMKKHTTTTPYFLYIHLESGNFDHVNYFHCDSTHTLLKSIPVLVTYSDLYYAPSLFITPSFTAELTKLFPEKTTVFHHLGRYLFNPSDVAWDHITEYYNSNNLAKAEVKLGLQIRVVNTNVPTQLVMDQILSCIHTHNILFPMKNTSSNSTIAILVASLFPNYAANLTATYYGKSITVHQPSADGRQRFNSGDQNMKAWVEMYLLSLTDKLVTTGESTFGYVAEGLSGFNPWVLRKPDGETGKSGTVACWKAPTIDPCFEFPPRYDCLARKNVDFVGSLFPDVIKMCEDRGGGWGIRLSDGGA